MWKPFPNEPPVRRFTKGHYYCINDDVLVEFKFRSTHELEQLANYSFIRLATRTYPATTPTTVYHAIQLNRLPIKEVALQDFPLYINWNTLPTFSEILNNGKRKTRTLSKSSKLIRSPKPNKKQ